MSGKIKERLAEIGKKSTEVIFEEALGLHGEMIKYVHKRSDSDFNDIIADLRIMAKNNSHALSGLTTADFKRIINYRVKNGIQTIGNHADILDEIPREAPKKEVETKPAPVSIDIKVEMKPIEKEIPTEKVCKGCDLPKLISFFGNTRGGGKRSLCRSCCSDRISRSRKGKNQDEASSSGENPFIPVDSAYSRLKKRNEELEILVDKYKNEECFMTEEQWLAKQPKGAGLYFISAILKDNCSGKLFNYIDQIEGKSEEHAIGAFVLCKEVKNCEIISLSYEKSIRDKSPEHFRSE